MKDIIEQRIQKLQNATTATEISMHASYFVNLIKHNEKLKQEIESRENAHIETHSDYKYWKDRAKTAEQRLEKAIELPCRQGDIVVQIYNNQIFEQVCTSFIVTKDNDILVGTKHPDELNTFEEVYLLTDVYPMFYGENAKAEAEAKLKELEGKV